MTQEQLEAAVQAVEDRYTAMKAATPHQFLYEPTESDLEEAYHASVAMDRARIERDRDILRDDPCYGLTLKGVPRRD